MHIHIFDEQLYSQEGHYLNYDSEIAAELERRGVPFTVYCAARHQTAGAKTLSAVPTFSKNLYEEVGQDPLIWAIQNFVELNAIFSAELQRLGVDRFSDRDIAFFPNVIQNQIDGIAEWISSLPTERRPILVLKLSYLNFAMPYIVNRPYKDMIQLYYRYSLLRLTKMHPRTLVCSDTEEMAKVFASIIGRDVPTLPMPLSAASESSVALNKSVSDGGRIRVTYFGHCSQLKGFHLLPDVIVRTQQSGLMVRFVVQVHDSNESDPVLANSIKSLMSSRPSDVEMRMGILDEAQYRRLLLDTDIALLPYSTQFYSWASSGIFSEAMSLGKLVVIPDQTWMARQLRALDGGGVIFTEHTSVAVTNALHHAVNEYADLSRKAVASAPHWKQRNCAASFVDQLLSLVRSAN